MLKKSIFSLVSLLMLCGSSQAQTINIDMSLNDGYVTESVSGQQIPVEGVLSPVNKPGAIGQALRFDGYSTYLKASLDASQLSTKTLTTSIWVAPENYPMMNVNEAQNAWTDIAGNFNETAKNGLAFQLSSQGDYRFCCYVNGWKVTVSADSKLPRYEWSHLVATINPSIRNVTLYNNGVQVGHSRCQRNGTINVGSNDFYIGRAATELKSGPFLINTFCGLIDDFTVYNDIEPESTIAATTTAKPDFTYDASRYEGDVYRPTFHGMPSSGWTNETHGAVYYNGRYHLFFQKNPNGPYMARLNWGHIWSDNLYDWHETQVAVAPTESYDIKGCWSGCVFMDDAFSNGKPTIFYTGVDNAKASIDMASPLDDSLMVWQKNTANPLIVKAPDGLSGDFRDCFFFSNDGKKYMIVGASANNIGAATLHRYDESTKTWSNDGQLFFKGTSTSVDGTMWEMPNLTKIGNKWLFTATPLGTGNGVKTLYWTGTIKEDGTFCPDSRTPKQVELTGTSHDGYGMLSPTIFKNGDKTLMLGIVPDKMPTEFNYSEGWAHCYSLPREISLDSKGNLVQKPFSGLTGMRTNVNEAMIEQTLNGAQTIEGVSGTGIELYGEFVVGDNNFGFNFYRQSDGNEAKLYYSPSDNTITLNVSGLDRQHNDDNVYDGIYTGTIPDKVEKGSIMTIHVFVDHSIVDVFVNDKYAFSTRIFADNIDGEAQVFADGATTLHSAKAWKLNPDNNEATDISAVKAFSHKNGRSGYYDLQGRQISNINSFHGVYIAIENGKTTKRVNR